MSMSAEDIARVGGGGGDHSSDEEVELQTSSDEEVEQVQGEEEEEGEEGGSCALEPIDNFKCGKCGEVDSDQVMLVHYGCHFQVFCCECRDEYIRKLNLLKGATEEQQMIAECKQCAGKVNPRGIQWCPLLQNRFYGIAARKCPLCDETVPFNDIEQHIGDCVLYGDRTYTRQAKSLVSKYKKHAKKVRQYRQKLCGYMRAQEEREDLKRKREDLLKSRRVVMERTRKSRENARSSFAEKPFPSTRKRQRREPVDMSAVLKTVSSDF